MTKKLLVTVACVLAFTGLFFVDTAHSYSSSPPANNSSAPGQSSCGGTGCHSSNPNSGTGNVAISLGEGLTDYLPGQTYDMSVTITDSDAMRYGFEMVAFNSSDESAGQFGLGADETGIEVREVGGVNYVNHKFATVGNSNIFNFTWTAPDQMEGNVSFYVAGNAANGSGNGGDEIYTSTLEVAEGMESGIEEAFASIHLYPNPASDQLQIDWTFDSSNETVQLYDQQGRLALEQIINSTKTTIDISSLETGLYLLRSPNSDFAHKVMVQ